jgi:hypothetical protein
MALDEHNGLALAGRGESGGHAGWPAARHKHIHFPPNRYPAMK